MANKEAICLNNFFTNKMKVDGELGWYSREINGSTGYHWQFRPDNSGVYEMVEEIDLHPSTEATGVPGRVIWKFQAKREGKGKAMFELYPPSGNEPTEKVLVEFEVRG